MKAFKYILPVLLIVTLTSNHVKAQSKINYRVLKKISEPSASRSQEILPLYIKGDTEKIKDFVRQHGGKVKYTVGNYAAVELDRSEVNKLASHPFVSRIEGPAYGIQPLNDTMVIHNNIVPVHDGTFPLSQEYDGEGVIIGFIDTGIDIDHEDFKDSTGKTRILRIWDQVKGKYWTNDDIDNGICTHLDDPNNNGHGTGVAGIAAGNGRAVNNFKGAAPKADIIMVATNFGLGTDPWLASVADGIEYIFSVADSLNKPCVINTSVGTIFGSRDAKDASAQIIEGLIEAKPGRIVVASSGNSGASKYHLGYEVTSDTNFTWFKYNSGINAVYYELFADTADLNNVQFAIGADRVSPGYLFRGHTPFDNIQNRLDKYVYDTLVAADTLGIVATYAEVLNGGVYALYVYIANPDSSQYNWRFMTTGQGKFDVWSHSSAAMSMGFSDMVYSIPDSATFPDIVHYKKPDTLKTIMSSWQCSPKVITVGNMFNRGYFVNHNGDTMWTNAPAGSIGPTSSLGPSRTGTIKPDITATGNKTLTAAYSQGSVDANSAQGGKHKKHGGTSMSSPVVAGIAALYLQKNPTATYTEFKAAIMQTAKSDTYTGDVPNHTWGYGKVDGFKTLTLGMVPGCTDTAAFNYNPDANVDDSSCIAKVFGCTDSTATNYNPNANVDDGSCIPVGLQKLNREVLLTNQPNPFSDETVIKYSLGNVHHKNLELHISDILGKRIKTIRLADNDGTVTFNRQDLKNGIYFYSLVTDGEKILTRKMVVY